ncbi:UPF0136 domain-containing protein [Blastomyces gilchristii SLH14081]|uniref:UPF0136 domain-containing protein n=1 Tax=Blastomyces gilchristii (strain SLH14081) TaxID=559298 RepID=A0A179UP74_BLAGS|nr:UPF0136 domain-containing protein [Blastomyces gilchristii SLH14081]OAT09028.1 UPF0136 domain-containing protein [Blastomyces gilchristii SLH14081]
MASSSLNLRIHDLSKFRTRTGSRISHDRTHHHVISGPMAQAPSKLKINFHRVDTSTPTISLLRRIAGLLNTISQATSVKKRTKSNNAAALSVLTSCGGIIGYARTGSIPSIAAGLSVGALYALSYYRLQGQQSFGEELSLIASTVLAGSAIPRALKTRKPVPIGLSILATYGLIVFGLAYKGKRATRV